MKPQSPIDVLGIMSGTSLDGVDIALCRFWLDNECWQYKFLETKTISFPSYWSSRLTGAHRFTGEELIFTDHEFGRYLGTLAKEFLNQSKYSASLISSHGHTIYHQPDKGCTFQAGNGSEIAAVAGITTISDFRILDIALGGQGAPLVPTGDEYLFPEYDACLNLGGFSNISFRLDQKRIAFDICPVNIVLNRLSGRSGLPFDNQGSLGRQGNILPSLLKDLNNLSFYELTAPKSLGREWTEQELFPLLECPGSSLPDILRTYYEHIGIQIARAVGNQKTVLLTGGGTHNDFLIQLLHQKCNCELVIPEKQLVDFKEALIFAFLGLLRIRKEINCFASVTGAVRDSCCGSVFFQ